MKKKVALIVLFCCLIAMSLTCFVACDKKDNIEVDKKDTVEIKVYVVKNIETENHVLESTLRIKKGSTFSVNDYFRDYLGNETSIFDYAYWGFYLNPACTKRNNDGNIIEKDTSLYYFHCSMWSMFIVFHYENKDYCCFVSDGTAKLSADTFAISAYGKSIDSSKLKYYSDSEMTQEIELVGKSFNELDIEGGERFFYSTKNVYVKYIA